jgi:hypothetical protein
LAKDTELVALGVCHDDPRLLALADVDTLRAMGLEAGHLGGLVIGPEVEMQSALRRPALELVIGVGMPAIGRPQPLQTAAIDAKNPRTKGPGVFWLVGLTGFEPVASSLSGMRSNQLSYSPAALCGVCPAR